GPNEHWAQGVLERTPTLVFSAGTQAIAYGKDGDEELLDEELDLRISEYTVGPVGPEQMPAEVPPGTDYTYAMELSFDQALDREVRLTQPVVYYLDNFFDDDYNTVPGEFSVGAWMPHFRYDRDDARWIRVLDEDGSPRDGLFVRILSNDFESDGVRRVQLDLDGSGEAAVANDYEELEISDRERELLSTETSQDGGIDGA